jgi:hypothetical protein
LKANELKKYNISEKEAFAKSKDRDFYNFLDLKRKEYFKLEYNNNKEYLKKENTVKVYPSNVPGLFRK